MINRSIHTTICIVAILTIVLIFAVHLCFSPNKKIEKPYIDEKVSLVIEGNVIETDKVSIFENNQTLLPINIVKEYFDKNIVWDDKTKRVIITTHDKIIKLVEGKATILEDEKPLKISSAVKEVEGTVYVPIDFLEDVYRIDIQYIKKNKVIVIDYRDSVKKTAKVVWENSVIRKGMSKKEPIYKWVKKGDTMRAFDEYGDWYKVRTDEGIVGYIQKKAVKMSILTSSVYTDVLQKPPVSAARRILNGKLNLVWDYVEYGQSGFVNTKKIQGLDIVSPTWFKLSGKSTFLVDSKADLKYMEWAKLNGYSVWPLFSNSCNTKLTSEILNDSTKREKVIKELLVYAKLYKIDGINVDFENMKEEDRDAYSQFIRELAPQFRKLGMIVSVDVGVPSSSKTWSLCFDRKAIGEAVDYIMLMTYDQHTNSGHVSGSVAQYTWVENKLKETLKEVPESKLLLGLPFYTREWKEEYDKNGVMIGKPTSVALSMNVARKRIKDNNASLKWDKNSGQYYAEYTKGKNKYRIWLEDNKSINLKSSLVHKYRLAGTAAWMKGFENEDTWTVLNKNLKEKVNYLEWAKANTLPEAIIN